MNYDFGDLFLKIAPNETIRCICKIFICQHFIPVRADNKNILSYNDDTDR